MSGDPDKRRTELTPPKCFRYGYEYQLIAKCPKLPKDNEKQQKNSVSLKGVIVNRKNNARTVIMITTKKLCIYGTNVW